MDRSPANIEKQTWQSVYDLIHVAFDSLPDPCDEDDMPLDEENEDDDFAW